MRVTQQSVYCKEIDVMVVHWGEMSSKLWYLKSFAILAVSCLLSLAKPWWYLRLFELLLAKKFTAMCLYGIVFAMASFDEISREDVVIDVFI